MLPTTRVDYDTKYARETHGKRIPDLRGVFVKGIDTATSNRAAGSVEGYATALPTSKKFVGSTMNGAFASRVGDKYNAGGKDYIVLGVGPTTVDITGGDDETRPKNVAVYYYIKIN
jgi:hypothetical protein